LFQEDPIFFVGNGLLVDVNEDLGVVEELSINDALLVQRFAKLSKLSLSLLL